DAVGLAVFLDDDGAHVAVAHAARSFLHGCRARHLDGRLTDQLSNGRHVYSLSRPGRVAPVVLVMPLGARTREECKRRAPAGREAPVATGDAPGVCRRSGCRRARDAGALGRAHEASAWGALRATSSEA